MHSFSPLHRPGPHRGPQRLGGFARALLLFGLTAATLPACQRKNGSGDQAQAETQVSGGVRARELPKVRVAPVVRREMLQVLETMCKLESEREIQLFPRMAGVVTGVFAEEGDAVEKGQILAELDDRDALLARDDARVAWEEAQNTKAVRELAAQEAKARIESATLAADQAERDYQRNLALFKGESEVASALSEQALEASRLERDRANNELKLALLAFDKAQLDAKLAATAVARAKVALDRAELALSHLKLTAPFSGVVARRDVRIGDSASTAAVAFVLSDIDALRAVFSRPQEELGLFQSGLDGSDADSPSKLPIRATCEALPGVEFKGHVHRVSPTIDRDSGQFRVTASLEENEVDGNKLLPGMLVRMHIITDRHPEVLVVPKRALRREGERRFLLVVEPEGDISSGDSPRGVLRRVAVREGFDDDDNIEVQPIDGDELSAGATVVVIGSRDLAQGDTVALDEELDNTSPSPPLASGADGDEPPPGGSASDSDGSSDGDVSENSVTASGD